MEPLDDDIRCQIACLPGFFDGYAEIPPESIVRKMRLLARRSLNVMQVRLIKTKTNHLMDRISSFIHQGQKPEISPALTEPVFLRDGDLVRVKSEAEIKATLNHWGILKGCMWMPDMAQYCGSVQQVFKVMERFVDERDYHVKTCHGIILLNGLHCQGTSDYGRCDRSCFYFWRQEWLEKIDRPDISTLDPASP